VNSLPVFLAVDKGYFTNSGLDVEVIAFRGPLATQLPALAHGDIDVLNITPAPSLFNQFAQGFDIKLVASMGRPRVGRVSDIWLTVLKEQAGQVRDLTDLRGKTIEALAPASAVNFVVLQAVTQAGLTPGKDVTVQHRAGGDLSGEFALIQAKGADVFGMAEPSGTQAEKDGSVVRWKSTADIVPWYQTSFFAASSRFLQQNETAMQKLLEVFVVTSRQVNASNGTWSDELLSTAAKWLDVKPDVITAQGGVPYCDPNSAISVDSLKKTQDFWVQQGQVKQPVDVVQIIDDRPLKSVLRVIGEVSD
jgi:NitT/TauT family transport system substrate-binding protein